MPEVRLGSTVCSIFENSDTADSLEIHTAGWTGDCSVTGFSCHQGQYCEDVTSGAMTDYAHSGNEDIKACAALCTATTSCKFIPSCTSIVKRILYTILQQLNWPNRGARSAGSCFIHTNRPDPASGFAACKTVNHTVTKLASTARGYSAYVKAK